MEGRVPSLFMLVPGPWHDCQTLIQALQAANIDATESDDTAIQASQLRVEIVEDSQLAAGFSWGRKGPLPRELLARVDRCRSAALIECGGRLDENHAAIAKLGRALREAGGVAVRMEASGAASAWEPWLEQLESGRPFGLYACATLIAEGQRGARFTCGMHQFDLPDAQIELSDPSEAAHWLDAFCVYQLEERPGLASGHRFRPSSQVALRSFERWPDNHHDDGDGRYNPFGIWRFLPPGATTLNPTALSTTLIPSLVSTLMAAEERQGRSLTRLEVAQIVSNAPAVAMTRADALALERSRGYADIEPELAWEQWQIIRRRA